MRGRTRRPWRSAGVLVSLAAALLVGRAVGGSIEWLLGQLEAAEHRTAVAEQRAALAREAYLEVRRQLRAQELIFDERDRQLGAYDVRDPRLPAPVPLIEGVVVALRKTIATPLVIVSIGSDDGVEKGTRLAVYRGGELMAWILVETVGRDSSGARVLWLAEGGTIRIGDAAATRSR